MHGLGTIINTAAVIVGGVIGLFFKKGISDKMQNSLMQACGLATMFVGISGTVARMLTFEEGSFSTRGTMLLIISLVLGTLIGEAIDVERAMESLGEKIKAAVKVKNDSSFVDGFVNVSLIICVGAMAIVGAIQDGISGDYSMLAAKAILDLIIVMVFAATYGLGAVFSAIPIFVYQGAITLAAMFAGAFVSDTVIWAIALVGSAMIFAVGINITFGKKIRVGNMLPGLIVAIIVQVVAEALSLNLM